MAFPTYSSRDVAVAFGGQVLDGLAPDGISFSRSTDLTETETGMDGQTSISILPDRSGTCTLSFQQGSNSNIILAGVVEGERAAGGKVIADLSISDPSGGIGFALLRNAHIQVSPEISAGSSASGKTMDWVFYCEDMYFTSTPQGAVSSDTARIASAIGTILSNI